MGGRQEGGRRPRFRTFWLTFFQSYLLLLFFSGLLSYLVKMKRRTSRHVHARETLTFFVMYLSPLTSKVYLTVNLFEMLLDVF